MKEEQVQRTHQKPISCWVWLGVPRGLPPRKMLSWALSSAEAGPVSAELTDGHQDPYPPVRSRGSPVAGHISRFGRSILWALLAGC